MVQLRHVAMWVTDIDGICAFYARHFDGRVGPLYENAAKGFASRFIEFASGARIEVMASTTLRLTSQMPGAQPMGWVHVALGLGSEQAVDALTERLRALGVPVIDGPRRTGDGYYESVVLDPEGNRIELTV